jgi:1-acyl-sn-glycerol-3-phosphate acyltransferase
VDLLHRGEGLVVFPEGTYYRGCMGPGKVGMTRFILSRLNLPFIPVGIEYRRSGLRVNVDIRFGARIRPAKNEPADRFVSRIMADIAALSGMAPPP